MSATDECPTCGGDCGTSECESLAEAQAYARASGFTDDEPCHHEHDEECIDEHGYGRCRHQHCGSCGQCGCAGRDIQPATPFRDRRSRR